MKLASVLRVSASWSWPSALFTFAGSYGPAWLLLVVVVVVVVVVVLIVLS
jgi:uncharacterized membrane protein